MLILDVDVFLPTGCEATAEQVAEMIADPANPVTDQMVAELPERQRPTARQLTAARAKIDAEVVAAKANPEAIK